MKNNRENVKFIYAGGPIADVVQASIRSLMLILRHLYVFAQIFGKSQDS